MPNPYEQALMTYARRAVSSPIATLLTGSVLVSFGVASLTLSPSQQPPFGFAMLAGLLWQHFQKLAAGTPRRLWPGFLRPQIIVFLTLSAVLILINVVSVNQHRFLYAFGAIAFSMTIFALVGFVVVVSWFAAILCAGLWFWLYTDHGSSFIQRLLTGQSPGMSIVLLVSSMATVGLILVWLAGGNEESSSYRWPIGRPGGQNGGPGTFGFTQATSEYGVQQWQLWRPRVLPRSGSRENGWAGVQRWRYDGGRRLLWMALIVFVVSALSWAAIGLPINAASLSFPIAMIGMFAAAQWHHRWRYLELESLRPVSRETFFRQLGCAMGMDYLKTLLAIWTGLFLLNLRLGHAPSAGNEIGMAGYLSAGGLMLVFGLLSCWALRSRSMARLMLIWFLSMLIAQYPSMLVPRPNLELPMASAIAIAMAVVGVMLTMLAYHLWLRTELG